MKRSAAVFTVTVLSLVILFSFSAYLKPVFGQSTGYTITSVDHSIALVNTGNLIVTDTIHLSGQLQGSFLMGFPLKYGLQIVNAFAYDSSEVLKVNIGVQLDGQNGFYGAQVNFPGAAPQVFTVVFVLSNNLTTLTSNGYVLDFPAYPSFATAASNCNVTLVLPSQAEDINVTKADGEVDAATYFAVNLPAFSYSPASCSFLFYTGLIQLVDLQTLTRQITVDPSGAVSCFDSYRLLNDQALAITSFVFNLPKNASNIVAKDQLNIPITSEVANDSNGLPTANVTLPQSLGQYQASTVSIYYSLPRVAPDGNQFSMTLDLLTNLNYYIDGASLTVTPPQGAQFLAPSLSSGESLVVSRDVFQQSVTFSLAGVSQANSVAPFPHSAQVMYEFSPLWIPLWATLWTWVLAVVGSIAIIIIKRPKPQGEKKIVVAKLSAGISPEKLEAFADDYNEKAHLSSDLKSLDNRAQKGRIPRRRYKVQRKTLETRIETLDKNIAELKNLLQSAGGSYSDLVRQLENAEKEIAESDTKLDNLETQHNSGELALDEYRRLQSDYQRRKEKAESAISGILLRLREELH
jgi:hypothetical protein